MMTIKVWMPERREERERGREREIKEDRKIAMQIDILNFCKYGISHFW